MNKSETHQESRAPHTAAATATATVTPVTLASADFQTFKRILSTEDKTHACERSLRRVLGDDDFLRWKERVSKGLARGTVAELRRCGERGRGGGGGIDR